MKPIPANPIIPLAELVASTSYDALPQRAIDSAKRFILDTLGVGVAGSSGPRVRELIDSAASWGSGEEATVWANGRKLPAGAAALANAYQIHALEFDCVHEPAVVHPMATLFSALLAHAERRGVQGRPVSGRELINATVLGVEIACTIGAASKSAMRFFRPATAGGFGVVAGIGAIERLDVPTLLNAFGILYGQTCGTLQAHVEGSMVLGLQVGFNARAGLTAVDLAKVGMTGPHDILTGSYGFYKLIEPEYDLAPWWGQLGQTWQVTRLAHKPFPSGRLTHAAIDAVQRLRKTRSLAAGDIRSIDAWLPPLAYRLVGRPDVASPAPNYAKLCVAFVMATALIDHAVSLESFLPEKLIDPAKHALAARINVMQDENTDANALWPQRFRIVLTDGTVHELTIEHAIGHPDNPLSDEAHLAKFRACWAMAGRSHPLGSAERPIAAVNGLESMPDVRELAALLGGNALSATSNSASAAP